MRRLRVIAAIATLALFTAAGLAADAVDFATAHGTVETVDKDSLTIKTRQADGKFGKTLVLQLTGTSRISTLQPQSRGGKAVMTQRETEAKDLQARQLIAVIYADGDKPVLLTAVVQPLADKDKSGK